ncbi:DUF4253 domain-containing protein [Streptomyces sp. JH14]|uniref:DUF4253 domain-containing protein n=1 Tax=Streptomyces sp. JH14 TaxID=2793630 RepID=UPI0023F8BC01|nr:DUF4253 domain-containing protein [Streptomyces sp. JH14]MDF6043095.1 DUF4253 domain-containing protein [Streptomyces sp. JH14]
MATLPNPLPSLATSGLRLPPGTLVDATHDGPWHEPLLWYADGPATPDTWPRLLDEGRKVGLLPVLLDGGIRGEWPEKWELSPGMMSYPGDHHAEDVLGEFWEEYAEDELEETAIDPFGPEWPGLAPAPAVSGPVDAEEWAAGIAARLTDADGRMPGARAALVPARRSADIPAAIGWTGPLNHENDVARLCAVLRSWEDRFGTRVVALGFDRLIVSVATPPTSPEEALALAAEHFAFCPDNIAHNTPDTLQAYADQHLLGQESWSFWWD